MLVWHWQHPDEIEWFTSLHVASGDDRQDVVRCTAAEQFAQHHITTRHRFEASIRPKLFNGGDRMLLAASSSDGLKLTSPCKIKAGAESKGNHGRHNHLCSKEHRMSLQVGMKPHPCDGMKDYFQAGNSFCGVVLCWLKLAPRRSSVSMSWSKVLVHWVQVQRHVPVLDWFYWTRSYAYMITNCDHVVRADSVAHFHAWPRPQDV